jgi:hypothetical protein
MHLDDLDYLLASRRVIEVTISLEDFLEHP